MTECGTVQHMRSEFEYRCNLTWVNHSSSVFPLRESEIDLGRVRIVQRRRRARKSSLVDTSIRACWVATRLLGSQRDMPARIQSRPGDVLYSLHAYCNNLSDLELALALLAAYGVAVSAVDVTPLGPDWQVLRSGYRRLLEHESWGGHSILSDAELSHIRDIAVWCFSSGDLTPNLEGALRAFPGTYAALGDASVVLGCAGIMEKLSPEPSRILPTAMPKQSDRRAFKQRMKAWLGAEQVLDDNARERIFNRVCDTQAERKSDTIFKYISSTGVRVNTKIFREGQDVRNKTAHGHRATLSPDVAHWYLKWTSHVLRAELEKASKIRWQNN